MQLKFKNNFFGYLQFYYSVLGKKLYFFILINALVGLLDGVGLAMFIPLLFIAFKEDKGNVQALGKLHYFTDALQSVGIPLTVVSVLIILIVLFSLKGLMRYWQYRYFAKMRYLFLTEMRSNLLSMLQKLSYKGFLQIDSGAIQNSFLTETGRLFGNMSNYFSSIQAATMLTAYIVLAILANYQFSVLVIIGGTLSSLLYKKIYTKTEKSSISISRKGNAFNSYLVQAINHFKYLKATDYFGKYAKKLSDVIKETETTSLQIGKYQAISEGTKEPIAIAIICIIVFVQFYFLKGNMNAIFVSLLLFYRSLTQLGLLQSNWQSFLQSKGSMVVISDIAQQMQAKQEEDANNKLPAVIGDIRLEQISLKYHVDYVLENLNLFIPKNKTIAFVGESGSGKTTLANVIIGLISPTSGNIWLGNQLLKNVDIHSYRKKIGYITQDPTIFNDTIFNNITFFDEPANANVQQFWKVIQLASLHDFVQSLPEKENSILGDNGILISGGQKQRISIARELYKNCELLVLDEATSALDAETENIIRENIDQLQGKYTIIIIAHRLSTIKNADTIYLLKNRQIVTFGSFDELINHSEEFKKMVQAQIF